MVSGMFSLVFKAREGFSRSIIILLIVALQFYVSTVAYKTDYLFTRNVFGWTELRFTQISTLDQGNICPWPQSKLIYCQCSMPWAHCSCCQSSATSSGSQTSPLAWWPHSQRSSSAWVLAYPGYSQPRPLSSS